MTTTGAPAADDISLMFPSFPALRTAHAELIARRRTEVDTPALLDDIAQFILSGSATGALIDADPDRWAIQSLLDYWSNILDQAGYDSPDLELAPFDPALAPELDDALCPYLGLDAFRENNQHLFFGRQRLLAEMIAHMQEHHLLAIVGASGSGKSSLVRAGLVPALRNGALRGSRRWFYFPPLMPGSDPLAALARLLLDAGIKPPGADGSGEEQLIAALGKDRTCLASLVQALSPESTAYDTRPIELASLGTSTVLIVDQFEEVFTLCDDIAAREAFIGNLLGLAQASDIRHSVVLTMRSDFETFVARMPQLQTLFEAGRAQVTPLSASELRETIEKPAELIGLKFEAGLVDVLMQDILGEPAALPLLQFTLLKLWEYREHNRLTWDAYRRVGGGRLALARSADHFYNRLIPEEQVTAKRILLRMVRPGGGLEVTSNRVRRTLLYREGEARDRVDRVLDKLIAARLVRLTLGEAEEDAQVEVAHEALVRNWPQLVEWLSQERAALRQRMRLAAMAEHWRVLGKDPSALLRGAILSEALQVKDLNNLESQFLRASLIAADQAEHEKEIAHKRELEQARSLARAQQARAETERQRAQEQVRLLRRTRALTLVIAVLGLVAGFAAVLAIFQEQELVCDAKVGYVFVSAWQHTRASIGCPKSPSKTTSFRNADDNYGSAEQQFEHGYMFYRRDLVRIYVLQNDRPWQDFPDTWKPGMLITDTNLLAPGKLVQPALGFGKIWREQLGGPTSVIGWGLEPERSLTLQVQEFDHGMMIFSDFLGIFALYQDGHWEAVKPDP